METSILTLILDTLNIGGRIYEKHLDRSWSKQIEKIQKRLWEETNKPLKDFDMVRVINLQKELERKLERFNRMLISQGKEG